MVPLGDAKDSSHLLRNDYFTVSVLNAFEELSLSPLNSGRRWWRYAIPIAFLCRALIMCQAPCDGVYMPHLLQASHRPCDEVPQLAHFTDEEAEAQRN